MAAQSTSAELSNKSVSSTAPNAGAGDTAASGDSGYSRCSVLSNDSRGTRADTDSSGPSPETGLPSGAVSAVTATSPVSSILSRSVTVKSTTTTSTEHTNGGTEITIITTVEDVKKCVDGGTVKKKKRKDGKECPVKEIPILEEETHQSHFPYKRGTLDREIEIKVLTREDVIDTTEQPANALPGDSTSSHDTNSVGVIGPSDKEQKPLGCSNASGTLEDELIDTPVELVACFKGAQEVADVSEHPTMTEKTPPVVSASVIPTSSDCGRSSDVSYAAVTSTSLPFTSAISTSVPSTSATSTIVTATSATSTTAISTSVPSTSATSTIVTTTSATSTTAAISTSVPSTSAISTCATSTIVTATSATSTSATFTSVTSISAISTSTTSTDATATDATSTDATSSATSISATATTVTSVSETSSDVTSNAPPNSIKSTATSIATPDAKSSSASSTSVKSTATSTATTSTSGTPDDITSTSIKSTATSTAASSTSATPDNITSTSIKSTATSTAASSTSATPDDITSTSIKSTTTSTAASSTSATPDDITSTSIKSTATSTAASSTSGTPDDASSTSIKSTATSTAATPDPVSTTPAPGDTQVATTPADAVTVPAPDGTGHQANDATQTGAASGTGADITVQSDAAVASSAADCLHDDVDTRLSLPRHDVMSSSLSTIPCSGSVAISSLSSSPSTCSLSTATDTLSTSISTSVSDLSISPPPLPPTTHSAVMCSPMSTSTTTLSTSTNLASSCTTSASAYLPDTTSCSEPVTIIIRDMSSVAACINRTSIAAPASSTVGELINQVGMKFGYEPDSFSLSLQTNRVTDQADLDRRDPWLSLADAGFVCDGVSRNSLLLMDLPHSPPKKVEGAGTRDDDLALGASSSPTSCGGDSGVYSSSSTAGGDEGRKKLAAWPDQEPSLGITHPSYAGTTQHEYTAYTSSSSCSRTDTGYVGLVNQAMTCYLNSLLQTLFMTPEFRNALYRWEFKGNKEEGCKSIPYQLQKLFLLLQTADRSAVETTRLTRSFGWDSSEAWQQHDIQELCRVMFEALEQSFANTKQANLIDTLYQGKMKDYVKCLLCDNENARMDSFLDIPLPIRPFGSSAAYQSLEEALRAFVTPELLDGNNQYQCSNCDRMCDAHKGLMFTRYPYLLTIHLKRFDFDYETFHRIKLNDRVTFPNLLDLSEFLEDSQIIVCSSSKSDSAACALDDAATDDSGSALDTEDSLVDVTPTHNVTQDEDEGIDLSASSDTERNSLQEKKLGKNTKERASNSNATADSAVSHPNVSSTCKQKATCSTVNSSVVTNDQPTKETDKDVTAEDSKDDEVHTTYQLFSIMIHSGSASGGHYYAYIKDFTSDDWFCFNDQVVTRISDDDIRRTYGSGTRGGATNYAASANAYMLMYRQCNEKVNVLPFSKENFPIHIKRLCDSLSEEEELEREARERERSTCAIKLYCHHPSTSHLSDLKLRVQKDATLDEATKQAHQLLELYKVVPVERCRLVKYEEYHDSLESSFEGMETTPMGELLGGVKCSYKFDLLMEVREERQKFEVYHPGGLSIKVYVVSLQGLGEVDGPYTIRGSLTMSVTELKKAIGWSLNLNSDLMRVVVEGFYNDLKLLGDGSLQLRGEGFYRSSKVYIEASGDESSSFYIGSQMSSVIDRYQNTMTLYCNLPEISPAILSSLNIPPYTEESPPGDVQHPVHCATDAISSSPPANTTSAAPSGSNITSSISPSSNSSMTCHKQTLTLPVPSSSLTTCNSSPTVPTPSTMVDTALQPPQAAGSNNTTRPTNTTTTSIVTTSSSTLTVASSSLVSADINGGRVDEIGGVPAGAVGGSLPAGAVGGGVPAGAVGGSLPAGAVAGAISDVSGSCAGGAASGNLSDGDDDEGGPGGYSAFSSDQSTSEDSSLTSDSDRTLVGDPPEEDRLSDRCNSPDYHNVSSPDEGAAASKTGADCWSVSCAVGGGGLGAAMGDVWGEEEEAPVRRYFKSKLLAGSENPDERVLEMKVDKRMTVDQLKAAMQPVLGVAVDHFKLYKKYIQEFECSRGSEQVKNLGDSGRLVAKLDRALLEGEYRGKVYMLDTADTTEHPKFLLDFVLREQDTVAAAKAAILAEVSTRCQLSLEFDKVRLRRKSWKNPQTVFLDHHVFGERGQITLHSNWEMFLQERDFPEPKSDSEDDLLVFVRRWRPSQYCLDTIAEVLLQLPTAEALRDKLSLLSDIPYERVEVAKGRSTFPHNVSVLEMSTELTWTNLDGPLDGKQMCILDDGALVYYRDKDEALKDLTRRERTELEAAEDRRLQRDSPYSAPVVTAIKPAKEKGLKIYFSTE